MPWEERSIMSSRRELALLAGQDGANKRALFRRYGIQPRIGYKWRDRFAVEGDAGLADRSRRPHSSPGRTPVAMEAKVIALRLEHPCWVGAS
jgi:transposase-like protein